MPLARRRTRGVIDYWPGFVDALSTLLIVIIFLVLVFALAQFFLNQALSGKDAALRKLDAQIAELADLLSLERTQKSDLQNQLTRLEDQLRTTIAARDEALSRLASVSEKATTLGQQVARRDIQISELQTAGDAARAETQEARQLSTEARARVDLLNQQIAALREQLAQISAALDLANQKTKAQDAQIQDLGQKLNVALATKVEELARYRSEFFGRLREVLGNQSGIRIVGDRFVFQSEVLFDPGSADLGARGRAQISEVAKTLREIVVRIPKDIPWILQVEGHTDSVPIRTAQFPSNWELASARALAVLRYLEDQGIAPEHMAAAGYGEFQPIDSANTEDARRRNRRIELKLTQR